MLATSRAKHLRRLSCEMRAADRRQRQTRTFQNPRELLEKMTCRLGGLLYLLPSGKPAGAQLEFKVLAPRSPSETEDMRILCGMPEIPRGWTRRNKGGSQCRSSRDSDHAKWREWLRNLTGELRSAAINSPPAIRKKSGTELAQVAKGLGMQECWFATALTSD